MRAWGFGTNPKGQFITPWRAALEIWVAELDFS